MCCAIRPSLTGYKLPQKIGVGTSYSLIFFEAYSQFVSRRFCEKEISLLFRFRIDFLYGFQVCSELRLKLKREKLILNTI